MSVFRDIMGRIYRKVNPARADDDISEMQVLTEAAQTKDGGFLPVGTMVVPDLEAEFDTPVDNARVNHAWQVLTTGNMNVGHSHNVATMGGMFDSSSGESYIAPRPQAPKGPPKPPPMVLPKDYDLKIDIEDEPE